MMAVPADRSARLLTHVAHYYDEVDVHLWTAAVAPTIYLSPSWFASVESKLTPTQRYVIVEQGSATVAAALYCTASDAYHFYNPLALVASKATLEMVRPFQPEPDAERAVALAERVGPPLRAAVCTAPFGYTQPLRATASDAHRSAVMEHLLVVADEWGAPVTAFLYADAGDMSLRRMLLAEGFIEFCTAANCVLERPAAGWDAYLGTLSPSRRSAVRREMRRFRERQLTITSGDIARDLDEMSHLQALVQAKYGHGYDPDAQRTAFSAIAQHLEAYVGVDLVHKNDELVGFLLYYLDRNVLYPKMVGFDYAKLDRLDYAYFNVTYYNMIHRAGELDVARIDYGVEAYDAKMSRGCRANRLVSYVKPPEEIWDDVSALANLVSAAMERRLQCHGSEPAKRVTTEHEEGGA